MIEVKNLFFAYDQELLFENLSFSLSDFNCAAILGLNGEGKSTLIRLLLGLLKAQSGQILINDQELSSLSEYERSRLLAYVPQENDDTLQISVSDFICLGGIGDQSIFKGPDSKDRERASNILKELEAEELYPCKLHKLSSGQRRLIYLARAIFQNSSIILMDEPVSSLDLIRQHRFLNYISNYSLKKDKKIIVSIHDPLLAYTYFDVFLFFKDHKLYDLLDKKDPHFKERLIEDISVLYDHQVKVEFLNSDLHLTYIP